MKEVKEEKFLISALSITPLLVFGHMALWEREGWTFVDSAPFDDRYFSVTYERGEDE